MSTIMHAFTKEDMESFKPTAKVGLIATVNEEGLPHITMITSMQANNPKELLVGEFFRGKSKRHIITNHRIAFLIMSLKMKLWRGTATWTHSAREGPEYEIMNQIPMFRYNTYFGIDTVHYFDLEEFQGPNPLPLISIITEVLRSKIAKSSFKTGNPNRILQPFIEDMVNQLTSFTFLSFIKPDGYPELIPLLQCQAADSRRLIFSKGAYKRELAAIPDGGKVAVFTMNLNMESILVRGIYNASHPSLAGNIGSVDIDWVYNSMVPAVGQIYPEVEISPVTNF
ncbi:MAG: pyridoxamine 5'-phosphate oxidase family protein [Anaerolineaceae bacterium]|nr:pyridoxamine 5'-phosphate oxidase family protein [Anaerolineaceae bacterium]